MLPGLTYLMIPGVRIKEAEGFAPRGRINYLVYARQRKWILWACFIETHIVNTHPPFPTLFFVQERDWPTTLGGTLP